MKTIAYTFVATDHYLRKKCFPIDALTCNDSLPDGIYCVNVTKDNTIRIKLPPYVDQYYFPWTSLGVYHMSTDTIILMNYAQYYQGHIMKNFMMDLDHQTLINLNSVFF